MKIYFAFKNRNYRHKQDPDYFLFLPRGQEQDNKRLIGKVFKNRGKKGTKRLEVVFFNGEHAPAGPKVLYASANENKVNRQDADMFVFLSRDDKTTERKVAGKIFINRSTQGNQYLKIIIFSDAPIERMSHETDKNNSPGA